MEAEVNTTEVWAWRGPLEDDERVKHCARYLDVPSTVDYRESSSWRSLTAAPPSFIRWGRLGDTDGIMKVESSCWPPEMTTPRGIIEKRLQQRRVGEFGRALVACDESGDLVGLLWMQIIPRAQYDVVALNHVQRHDVESLAAETWTPDEQYLLQFISLSVHPLHRTRGVARVLLHCALRLGMLCEGIERAFAVSRCSTQSEHPRSEQDVVRLAACTPACDPTLQFHADCGAVIGEVVRGYWPEDTLNSGCGVLVHYALGDDVDEKPLSGRSPQSNVDSTETLRQEIVDIMQTILGGDAVNPQATFESSGMDSLELIRLGEELTTRGLWMPHCDSSMFFHHPTPQALALALTGHNPEVSNPSARSIRPSSPRAAAAIAGMWCELPGASSPLEFWDLLRSGGHAISPAPLSRPDLADLVQDVTLESGFLENALLFTPRLYGISVAEGMGMDPQQRVLLRVVRMALFDAGLELKHLEGKRWGIFIGEYSHDFESLVMKSRRDGESAQRGNFRTDTHSCALAGRLAFVLKTTGPALCISTACSSGMVALSTALTSLHAGECDAAIVASVQLNFARENFEASFQSGTASRTHRCRPFRADADGYVRSEGCVAMVLCPQNAKTLGSSRPVISRAHLNSCVVNHDGASNGLVAPNPQQQQQLFHQTFTKIGAKKEDVSYLEAHGTGTLLGDQVELDAIMRVFTPSSEYHAPVVVGCAKSVVGHTEAVAGLVGVVKATLALEHGTVPGDCVHGTSEHIHKKRLGASAVTLTDQGVSHPLREDGLVLVSSFGTSGTNAQASLAMSRRPDNSAIEAREEAVKKEWEREIQESTVCWPEAMVAANLAVSDEIHGHVVGDSAIVPAAAFVVGTTRLVKAVAAHAPRGNRAVNLSLRRAVPDAFMPLTAQLLGDGRVVFVNRLQEECATAILRTDITPMSISCPVVEGCENAAQSMEELSSSEFYGRLYRCDHKYEGSFQCIKRLFRKANVLLAELHEGSEIVPALDGAMQLPLATLPEAALPAVPYFVKEMHCSELTPSSSAPLWVAAQVSGVSKESENEMVSSLWLLDDSGTELISLHGVSFRLLGEVPNAMEQCKPPQSSNVAVTSDEMWEEVRGTPIELIESCVGPEHDAYHTIELNDDDDYDDGAIPESIASSHGHIAIACSFRTVQPAVSFMRIASCIRAVARYATACGKILDVLLSADSECNVAGVCVGLAQCARLEYAHCLRIRSVVGMRGRAGHVANALKDQSQAQYVMEAGNSIRPLLQRRVNVEQQTLDDRALQELGENDIILITGASGAIGRHIQRHFSQCKLVCLSRSGEGDVIRCDVSNRQDVESVVKGVLKMEGSIRGVLHCAGVNPLPRSLEDMGSEYVDVVASTFDPKVVGTTVLLEVLSEALSEEQLTELKFVVLFSSLLACTGQFGAASYASANFEMERCASQFPGLPICSVRWGGWDGGGMAEGVKESLKLIGQNSLIPPKLGLRALDQILALQPAQRTGRSFLFAPKFSWETLQTLLPSGLQVPLRDPMVASSAASSAGTSDVCSAPPPAAELVLEIVAGCVRDVLPSAMQEIDLDAPFMDMGITSLGAIELKELLESRLRKSNCLQSAEKLPATLILNYPTMRELQSHVGSLCGVVIDADSSEASTQVLPRSLPPGMASGGDVAIVSMACRLPGASSPDEFWQMLISEKDAVDFIPYERFAVDHYYSPQRTESRSTYVRRAALLSPSVRFDSSKFRISDAEVECMDPQQRVALSVCSEVLENAGMMTEGDRRNVGIFVGQMCHDWLREAHSPSRPFGPYSVSGASAAITANRISFALNLGGPSVTLDTACSSSLVAMQYAWQCIQTGECSAAIVCGVNIILSAHQFVEECAAQMLSPGGRCASFDVSADGYARGEGCGAVLLMSELEAVKRKLPVEAMIAGLAVNQDGRSARLTAPNVHSQVRVIQRALHVANIDAREVGYIETHGTGTPLGDPVEVAALVKAYGAVDRRQDLVLGAVKTNIGHLEAAAGIASVIKAVLALRNGVVPPNLHFSSINPEVAAVAEPFIVLPRDATETNTEFCGVSSFGFGGTNAHVILRKSRGDLARPPPVKHSCVAEAAFKSLTPTFHGHPLRHKTLPLQDDQRVRVRIGFGGSTDVHCVGVEAARGTIAWDLFLVESLMAEMAPLYSSGMVIQGHQIDTSSSATSNSHTADCSWLQVRAVRNENGGVENVFAVVDGFECASMGRGDVRKSGGNSVVLRDGWEGSSPLWIDPFGGAVARLCPSVRGKRAAASSLLIPADSPNALNAAVMLAMASVRASSYEAALERACAINATECLSLESIETVRYYGWQRSEDSLGDNSDVFVHVDCIQVAQLPHGPGWRFDARWFGTDDRIILSWHGVCASLIPRSPSSQPVIPSFADELDRDLFYGRVTREISSSSSDVAGELVFASLDPLVRVIVLNSHNTGGSDEDPLSMLLPSYISKPMIMLAAGGAATVPISDVNLTAVCDSEEACSTLRRKLCRFNMLHVTRQLHQVHEQWSLNQALRIAVGHDRMRRSTGLFTNNLELNLSADGILHVILNVPDRMNSLSAALLRDLEQVIAVADSDPRVQAIILRGEGKHFCTGADGGDKELLPPTNAVVGEQLASTDAVFASLKRIRELSVPLVSIVKGHVIGGGLALALCADRVLAVKSCTFQHGNAPRGVSPLGLYSKTLQQRIGFARSFQFYASDETMETREALEMGLVDDVFEEEAAAIARCLALLGDEVELNILRSKMQMRLTEKDDDLYARELSCMTRCRMNGGGFSLVNNNDQAEVVAAATDEIPTQSCIEINGDIGVVVVPRVLNEQFLRTLERSVRTILRQVVYPSCIVFVGSEPGVFGVGGSDGETDVDLATELRSKLPLFANLAATLRGCSPIRLVSLVDGPCVGGSMIFPLMSDAVICTKESKFGFPELRRGVAPTVVSALASHLSKGSLRYLTTTAQVVSAAKAQEYGIVNKIVLQLPPVQEILSTTNDIPCSQNRHYNSVPVLEVPSSLVNERSGLGMVQKHSGSVEIDIGPDGCPIDTISLCANPECHVVILKFGDRARLWNPSLHCFGEYLHALEVLATRCDAVVVWQVEAAPSFAELCAMILCGHMCFVSNALTVVPQTSLDFAFSNYTSQLLGDLESQYTRVAASRLASSIRNLSTSLSQYPPFGIVNCLNLFRLARYGDAVERDHAEYHPLRRVASQALPSLNSESCIPASMPSADICATHTPHSNGVGNMAERQELVPKDGRQCGIGAIEVYCGCESGPKLDKPASEDSASLAMTAVWRLMHRLQLRPTQIGKLVVGSETPLDRAKSIKSIIMGIFEQHDDGTADVEGVDVYGASHEALFSCVDWMDGPAWNGKLAIAVVSDGRLSFRCAVAMLIVPQAPLALLPYRSASMGAAWDYWHPIGSSSAALNVEEDVTAQSFADSLQEAVAGIADVGHAVSHQCTSKTCSGGAKSFPLITNYGVYESISSHAAVGQVQLSSAVFFRLASWIQSKGDTMCSCKAPVCFSYGAGGNSCAFAFKITGLVPVNGGQPTPLEWDNLGDACSGTEDHWREFGWRSDASGHDQCLKHFVLEGIDSIGRRAYKSVGEESIYHGAGDKESGPQCKIDTHLEGHSNTRAAGILAMEMYVPRYGVAAQELEAHDSVEGKYTSAFDMRYFAAAGDDEDAISMAITAAHRLLRKAGVGGSDIGKIVVATESLVDAAKSMKSAVASFLGIRKAHGADSVNACYGGCEALLSCVSWVESSSWDGRYALLIASDISDPPDKQHFLSGGAAMACLIGKNATLEVLPERASAIRNRWDFWKPVGWESMAPLMDGPMSKRMYIEAMQNALDLLASKTGFKSRAELLNDSDALVAHLGSNPGFVRKSVASALPDMPRDVLNRLTSKSLLLGSSIGPMHTCSVFANLLSLAGARGGNALAAAQNIVVFSFGSGYASTAFRIRVNGSLLKFQHSLQTIESSLRNRVWCSGPSFVRTLSQYSSTYGHFGWTPVHSDSIVPNVVYLRTVQEQGQRVYEMRNDVPYLAVLSNGSSSEGSEGQREKQRHQPHHGVKGDRGTATAAAVDAESISRVVRDAIQVVIGTIPDREAPLVESGLDSLGVLEFRQRINKALPSADLSAVAVFEHPTMAALEQFILEKTAHATQLEIREPPIDAARLAQTPHNMRKDNHKPHDMRTDHQSPDRRAYWQVLSQCHLSGLSCYFEEAGVDDPEDLPALCASGHLYGLERLSYGVSAPDCTGSWVKTAVSLVCESLFDAETSTAARLHVALFDNDDQATEGEPSKRDLPKAVTASLTEEGMVRDVTVKDCARLSIGQCFDLVNNMLLGEADIAVICGVDRSGTSGFAVAFTVEATASSYALVQHIDAQTVPVDERKSMLTDGWVEFLCGAVQTNRDGSKHTSVLGDTSSFRFVSPHHGSFHSGR